MSNNLVAESVQVVRSRVLYRVAKCPSLTHKLIDAGKVTAADILAVVGGAGDFGVFDRLQKLTKVNES
ncbi:hypothetical protein QUA07_28225 [Microcoleus sp. T3_A4]|uniref:hypothetical protein n=1 Tax=Microcoleus sp. T3_A4 TaxID=2818968 RepID=UPI002FD64886